MVEYITTDTVEKNAEMTEIGTGNQSRQLYSSKYSKLKDIKIIFRIKNVT